MKELKTISISTDQDVVAARAASRELAKSLGFGAADQTRLATAVSELTRNILRYAKTGECHIEDQSDDLRAGIRVVVEDQGPGIPDLNRAMEDGFTTGGGLGAGLPGTKRLVHDFDTESRPGHTKGSPGIFSKKRAAAPKALYAVSGRSR